MAIYYFGDHSVTFIKKSGNLITYKRSWVDWRLVPASRPIVSPAAPNVQIVSIPGSNRTIDLTESLSGSVTFGRRSGTWAFIVDHDKWSNWYTAYKEIMTFVNGQELYCVLEDDHDTVYHGRLALNEWSNGDNYSQITIGYNFEYDTSENNFTYSLTKSVSSINATYNQNRRITTNSSLDDLREDLVVTATFDNGDVEEIEYYTLEGDLSTIGTKTITVSCNNETDTFTVEVLNGAIPSNAVYVGKLTSTNLQSGSRDFTFKKLYSEIDSSVSSMSSFYDKYALAVDCNQRYLNVAITPPVINNYSLTEGYTEYPDFDYRSGSYLCVGVANNRQNTISVSFDVYVVPRS